jgi:hypothetical protein
MQCEKEKRILKYSLEEKLENNHGMLVTALRAVQAGFFTVCEKLFFELAS